VVQIKKEKSKMSDMAVVLSEVSNDGAQAIEHSLPYIVDVSVEGSAAILFHRWSVDGVAEKAKAAKGSKAKKEDNLESYVYRDLDGFLCIPTEYFRMSMIYAAKFKQDPRSPRKSAMDLFKAGIAGMTDLCSLGIKEWQYVDRRRVMVQRNGITRHRPACYAGWKTSMSFQILLPEYINSHMFNEVLQSAGRLIGVGDFRPTYGRFQVTKFTVAG
jgi:hypothetical protein